MKHLVLVLSISFFLCSCGGGSSTTNSPAALSITTSSLASGKVGVAYSATLTAGGGTPPYTWSWSGAAGSALPPGLSLSTSGAITGTPTTSGTFNMRVTATDSGSPKPQTAQQAYGITVAAPAPPPCGAGNEALLTGQYAFSLSGFNATTYEAMVGSFMADGTGKITAGEMDLRTVLGAGTSPINPTYSSYSVGSDHRGCAFITTTYGTFTTRFVLGSISGATATQGRIIEFEFPSASAFIASGELVQQNSSSFSAGLSGSYAFGSTGWDFNTGKPAHTVGALSASGGQITAYEMVVNDGGSVIITPEGSISGTYSNFDAYGRGTVSYTSPYGPATAALYMTSASKFLYLLRDGSPASIGDLLQQTVPNGGFTLNSLSGKMVLYGGGVNAPSSEESFIGFLNSTGAGSLTISIYDVNGANNLGEGSGWLSLQNAFTYTCSYSVASSGRIDLRGNDPNCAVGPVFYLAGANTAWLLGQSSQFAESGAVEPQAALTFNNSTLSGAFFKGPQATASQAQETEVNELALANGGGTFISDITSTTGQEVDYTGPSSYTINADGTVTVVQSGVPIVQLIVINPNKFVMINNVTAAYPYVMVAEQ